MNPRIYTYKITFEECKYYYFGSKKEKKFNDKYMGSPKTNRWAWELYTPKKQILETFSYDEEGYRLCREVEERLIKYCINDPNCLNAGYFGYYKQVPFTSERRNKISKSLRGKKASTETRKKLSSNRIGIKNSMFGKKHSAETKNKISKKALGRKHSKETKLKISIAFKGERHPLYGKGHSEESKRKMSSSKIGKYIGRNNPKCRVRTWIHPRYGLQEGLAIFELVQKFPSLSLNPSKLSSVANKKSKSHKGWTMVE